MRTRLPSLLACLAALALSCLASSAPAQGKRSGTITGKVTYQGKPLSDGFVNFSTEDRKIETKINADGTYSIRRLPVGTVKVHIESKTVAIPKKYASSKTSGLKIEVKEGNQEINIDLK
jgi:hypothetical protein